MKKNFYSNKIREPQIARNERIKSEKVRLISETGENLGVLKTEDALELARSKELDLVLISPNLEVPIAKIADWSKLKYLKQKKDKNKGKSVTVKEWWFKAKIEQHDINNKLNQVEKFLKKGGKVKITIKMVKRATYEQMYETLNKVLELSEVFAEKASDINREGRNISVFLKYKKQNNEKQNKDTQKHSEEV